MTTHYRTVAFTDDVREAQRGRGTRDLYARVERRRPDDGTPDMLTSTERAFIAARDHFYIATVSKTGWPYVQHRGGPPGFIRVFDDHTLGWADFAGNAQYLTGGNLAGDDRVALLLVDYVSRRRLELLGHGREAELADHPELASKVVDADYGATVERVAVVSVEAFDWNCPQHITPRYTLGELGALLPAECLTALTTRHR